MPVRPAAAANVGVGSWIERRARIAPDDLALIADDRSFTYDELARRIRRLANGLRGLGVARGDRVAWLGPNHEAFLEVLFASGLLGTTLAPVNHRLEPAEIRGILQDTDPALLVRHGSTDPASVPPSVRHRISVGDPAGAEIDVEALAADSPDDPIDVDVGPDDLCLLPHTSGTTGAPKGIMLTHANVTWNALNFLTCADFRRTDVTIAIAPFFRVGGTGVNVLPVLLAGGAVVVPVDVTPEEILRRIERHRVSVGFGNPDILEALTRSPAWSRADLSSVRFVLTGGAPVPERLIRTYLDRGVALVQGYGLSEAAPLALLLDPARALEKIGSAGRPPLFVDVRIEGPAGGPAGPGETGELLVRGPNVMAGYWNRPDATREALTPDGWLRTGDAARSDDEGDVWIVDRVADRFLSEGRAVYPGDVERVLSAHPSIADAGVVQIDDERGEAVVVAVVVRSAGSAVSDEDVVAFARRRLDAHQVPALVRFADALPRSSVGKLIRSRLRAVASEPATDP